MVGLLAITLVVVIVGGLILLVSASGKSSPSPEERRELKNITAERDELKSLVHRIDKIAYDNRMIDPALSTMIVDEIANHKRGQSS